MINVSEIERMMQRDFLEIFRRRTRFPTPKGRLNAIQRKKRGDYSVSGSVLDRWAPRRRR